MRIVSLLPAATEIVCALGLRESLVARSHACDFPEGVGQLPALTRSRVDSSLPSGSLDAEVRRVVTQGLPLYELDEARLAELRPDVVVTQETCAVCAVSRAQVAACLEGVASPPRIVSLSPARLSDVLSDVRAVAAACGVPGRAAGRVRELEGRLRGASRGARRPLPRVAVLEWLDPPMLAGHWVPETLEAAGSIPVGPPPGARSPQATWDEIQSLQPDALVVAPCGLDLPRVLEEARGSASTLSQLAPRVLLLDGNAYLNRPGPRLADAAETVGAWLRGEGVSWPRGLDLGRATAVLGGRS